MTARLTRARFLVPCLLAALVVAGAAVAAPASAAPEVDAWGRDPDSLSGTIEQVCGPGPSHDAAAQRPGRVALMAFLDETFPEAKGFSGFVCREIHNPRTSCPGRKAPARSSCWSTHAAGRAIDIGVGGAGDQDGVPVGKVLGDRIVNFLLATVDGIPNYRARVMGVQQLLWDGRCWSTREHAGAAITDINQLDGDCVDLHDDHVHITLSAAGADGLTSFHSGEVHDGALAAPAGDPRDAHLLAYDAKEGRLLLRGFAPDGTFTEREASDDLATGWTALATPDVGGNGNDELFVYDQADGRHELREIRPDGSMGSTLETGVELDPGWTLAASPDVDGDGDDELLLYRGDDGRWALHELHRDGTLGDPLQPEGATLDVFFTSIATPDLDGDGRDELVLYRQFDGHHVVLEFADAEVVAEAVEAREEAGEASLSLPSTPPVVAHGGLGPEPDDGEDVDAGEAVTSEDADAEVDAQVDVDHEIDVTVDVATAAPNVVDADGLPVDLAELDTLDLPAGAVGLGGMLTAGFTTMAAVDVDADAVDELALYRAGDGCLAIRRLQRHMVVVDDGELVELAIGADQLGVSDTDTDDADADAGDATAVSPDQAVQPCLGQAPTDDAGADSTDGDTAGEDVGTIEALDPATWLLESRDGLEPGWSTLLGTAIDPEGS